MPEQVTGLIQSPQPGFEYLNHIYIEEYEDGSWSAVAGEMHFGQFDAYPHQDTALHFPNDYVLIKKADLDALKNSRLD